MFGIGLILVGILILLRSYGFLRSVSDPAFWGVAFILIGILIMACHAMRRQRRREWIAQNRAAKKEEEKH